MKKVVKNIVVLLTLSALIVSTAGLNIYYHSCSSTGEKFAIIDLTPDVHKASASSECPMCLEHMKMNSKNAMEKAHDEQKSECCGSDKEIPEKKDPESKKDKSKCCSEDYVYLVNDSLFDFITVSPVQNPAAAKYIIDFSIIIVPVRTETSNHHRVLKEPPVQKYGRGLLSDINLMLA